MTEKISWMRIKHYLQVRGDKVPQPMIHDTIYAPSLLPASPLVSQLSPKLHSNITDQHSLHSAC